MNADRMKYLHFDLRALGLMRICVAAVIIIDLSIRMSDLEAFYSDTGAVPLSMVFQHAWNRYFFSVHTISGLWQVQLVLFMISVFCALMLLIGYRTRLFTILSWLLMLSMHNRNVFILQGGDDVLRMILFWAMFIPWGERYSYDSLAKRERGMDAGPQTIFTLATLAYMLQLAYLYTGSALLKGPEWNRDFTAVYYAYSLDQITYPHVRFIYYYPQLLRGLTMIAYYFELLVPLLFIMPFAHERFRLLAVCLITGFHGFNLGTMMIGIFPLVGISTGIGMLPSFVMDRFDRMTLRIRKHVAGSFAGIAWAAGHLLKWKPSLYATGGWRHKVNIFVMVFLIVFVADWNISNLAFVHSKVPQYLHPLAYALRIDQCWGMFAPGVLKDDGWYVFEGDCRDGICRNLLSEDGKIEYVKKPHSVVSMFKNDRWRKYAENYIFIHNDFMRPYFCDYYRRAWNKGREEQNQVERLRIYYVTEMTQPDYGCVPPRKDLLCDCAD